MAQKAFLVNVTLDIQAITCPGVYLCSNGKISLQLSMLDSCIQTESRKPFFPVICNEKYVFHKTFTKVNRLNDLQRSLYHEWLYVELIQWQNCEEGRVLAIFQTTLDDLLYPPYARGCIAGLELELLMEPTKLFPGTISPKLEISTKTSITETICDYAAASSVKVNPKLLLCAKAPAPRSRPRKVCHSVGFSNAKKNARVAKEKRPPFVYRHCEDDLILRNNPNLVITNANASTSQRRVDNGDLIRTSQKLIGNSAPVCTVYKKPCCCCRRSKSVENHQASYGSVNFKAPIISEKSCSCETNHKENYCHVCSKYKSYFTSSDTQSKCKTPKLCLYCKQNALDNKKYHIKSKNGSPCDSATSSEEEKTYFCICKEKTRTLAQQLHRKLKETLDTNSQMLRRSCIDCEDYL